MKYYGITRSSDHLAHYGVKGMKWGVRKAIYSGNQRALDRHYRKAAKKLAKLTDIGLNSKKYAARSIAYGAAAAGTGTLAIGGTKALGSAIYKLGSRKLPHSVSKTKSVEQIFNEARLMRGAGKRREKIASIINAVKNEYKTMPEYKPIGSKPQTNSIMDFGNNVKNWGQQKSGIKIATGSQKLPKGKTRTTYFTPTNDMLYRAGTGLITAGLAAKSVQNAYRASHSDKYRSKALNFKNEMDKAFAGTKYEGHYERLKRRKRR